MAPDSLPASRFSRTVLGYGVRSLSSIASLSKLSNPYYARAGGALDACVISWVRRRDALRGGGCCGSLSAWTILSGASPSVRRGQHASRLGLCSRCALTLARPRAGGYACGQVGGCHPVRLAVA